MYSDGTWARVIYRNKLDLSYPIIPMFPHPMCRCTIDTPTLQKKRPPEGHENCARCLADCEAENRKNARAAEERRPVIGHHWDNHYRCIYCGTVLDNTTDMVCHKRKLPPAPRS